MTLLFALVVALQIEEGPDHPIIGITGTTAAEGGVSISSVYEKSPATAAGIQSGDRIVRFGSGQIDTMEQLQALVKSAKIGDRFEVEIVRNGETVRATVFLASRNDVMAGTYEPLVRPVVPEFEAEPKAEKEIHRGLVERLLARLSDEDFRERDAAAEAVTAFGPAVRPYLKPALESADLEIHSRATRIARDVMRPVPRGSEPDPATRTRTPSAPVPLDEALAGDKPVAVFCAPPCEFDCARRLSAALRGDRFAWVVVAEYGEAYDAMRARFKTERAVFIGFLDKDGAPVGELLGIESSPEALRAALE